MNIETDDHVSAAWIAREVGVGRAAVANWRKRYSDFPQPVAGDSKRPLFSWAAVQRWLVTRGKPDRFAAVTSARIAAKREQAQLAGSVTRTERIARLAADPVALATALVELEEMLARRFREHVHAGHHARGQSSTRSPS